jgi:glycosyltransferase involved in cell wall biosynthesis
VLEAMAMETPIVATDVGGTRELADDGTHALLVARHDVAGLTRALGRAIDDRAASAARARAARRRVETVLSFDQRMRKVEAIYDELMADRAR